MEGTMKAAVLEDRKKLVLKEIPIPKIGPRDVLFKVSYASICGSDLPIYNDLHYVTKMPLIPGHEFTGYVVEVGDQVEGIPVGMRFMGTNVEWCGKCEECKSGNVGDCNMIFTRGLGFGRDGVFAEYSVIHNAMLGVSVIPLPENINDLYGATCEPMCVGIGCVENIIKPEPKGERIVIYGAGMVGQSFIQAFRATCEECEIAVVDVSDLRLELAKKSGADIIINPSKGKSAYDILTEHWGFGKYAYHDADTKSCGNATISVECTGNMSCVSDALEIVTRRGKACFAAGYGDDDWAKVRPLNFMLKQVKVLDGYGGSFQRSVDNMAAGVFSTKDLITQVYPLDDIQKGMDDALNPQVSCKVCIKVDPTAPDFAYNKQG